MHRKFPPYLTKAVLLLVGLSVLFCSPVLCSEFSNDTIRIENRKITTREFREAVESGKPIDLRNDTIVGDFEGLGGTNRPTVSTISISSSVFEQHIVTAGIQLSEFSHIRFDRCHFKKSLVISQCYFAPWSAITFLNCQFDGWVSLDKCEFAPFTEILMDSCFLKNGISITEGSGKWLFRLYNSKIQSGCVIEATEWVCQFSHCDFMVGSYIRGDFENSSVWECKFFGTAFEMTKLPSNLSLGTCVGVDKLTYKDSPAGLSALKNWFKSNGYRQKEREATYAIHRTENMLRNQPAKTIESMLFDFTSGWGMNYTRPLCLDLILLLLLWPVYWLFALNHDKGDICRVWTSRRTGRHYSVSIRRLKPLAYRKRFVVARLAFLFSLMSAFNIGFREFNFGVWIRNITKNTYDLKATGWARPFAGVQALLSVFLFALFLLTYFGRPFD